MATLAERLGFTRAGEKDFRSDSGDRREVIWDIDAGLTMHYVDDGISGARFFEVRGDDVDDVADIAESLSEMLRPLSYDDLLDAHRNATTLDEKKAALLRAALGAPPERDDDFAGLIEHALRSTDGQIREAGLWAATYYGLPDFIPAIQAIARDDADLADLAKDVLRGFKERGLP
ncbi:hypothetical protein [Amycolatopsis sp. NPDC059657]|uniref:hypothetical protein n=1 Tax=Amycolatopsis sp. NPDC059657 TaxID=3346899 RepID=UPI00366FD4C9